MNQEQAFQAHKNASSASVSRYGGTTWAAGSGSVDLEIEAEDEPPGAARLNPGDITQTHIGDNTVEASATNTPVDHATTVLSHANDQLAADTTTNTSARVDGSNDTPTSAPAQTTTDPDEDSLPDISTFIRPDATGYVPVDGSRVSSELLSGLDPTAADRVGVSVSWVNPKLRACTSTTGSGMFAIQPITKGEHLIVWTGKIVTAEEALAVMGTDDKHYLLQIGDGFYQTPLSQYREPADYTNHSCEPTAGFGKGSPICLSAMCDIPIGGQVLFDYGMCETDPRLWEPMECLCGTPSCRKWITANDWYLYPDLWDRYAGYWSPHVQRQIDAYRADLEKKKNQQVGAEIPAADMTPSTSAHSLTLPTLEVMDSPAFTPMQVSSTSPSSSGSSSPISRASTPVSSPPFSPRDPSSSAPDMLLPSARLSQAKAKAKAKLAKQVDIKVNKKKSPTAGIHFETTSSSSSSSSGDESDVEVEEDHNTKEDANTTTTGVTKQEYTETISTSFYIQWMDRMLATIGLQRIQA